MKSNSDQMAIWKWMFNYFAALCLLLWPICCSLDGRGWEIFCFVSYSTAIALKPSSHKPTTLSTSWFQFLQAFSFRKWIFENLFHRLIIIERWLYPLPIRTINRISIERFTYRTQTRVCLRSACWTHWLWLIVPMNNNSKDSPRCSTAEIAHFSMRLRNVLIPVCSTVIHQF